MEKIHEIYDLMPIEIEHVAGGRWWVYVEILQAIEWCGDKAYELGHYMGSH